MSAYQAARDAELHTADPAHSGTDGSAVLVWFSSKSCSGGHQTARLELGRSRELKVSDVPCRGNARSRQGKFDAALKDYNKSIELCPWSVDPILNRGVLYENTGRLAAAERDYRYASPADAQDELL